MIYFIFSILSVMYFYAISSNRGAINNKIFLIITMPFCFFYFLFPAIQYGVGTDYYNYLAMYKSPSSVSFYDEKLEFFFSYILRFVNEIDLGGQFIFVVYSVFFTLSFLIFLYHLNGKGVKIWLFLFAFLFCSGIYQNQMNGIRQYAAIYMLMLSIFYILEDKSFRSIAIFISGIFMHSSFIINLPILFLKYIVVTPRRCVLAFVLSFIFFGFFVPIIIPYILAVILPQYLYYLGTDLVSGWSVLALIPKLYYFPMFLAFIYLYKKDYKYNKEKSIVLSFSFLACCLYWCFLSYSSVGLMTRVGLYWSVFNCFPIYYVLNKFFNINKFGILFLTLLYLLFPFSLKVLFFPVNEYIYNSILG